MVELSLIDGEVPVPDAEVRAILDGGVPIISPYYRAVCAVFPGSGFRAALIRGVIMSFQLLSRTAYPQKVFATIDAAAGFSHPHALAANPGPQLARPRASFDRWVTSRRSLRTSRTSRQRQRGVVCCRKAV